MLAEDHNTNDSEVTDRSWQTAFAHKLAAQPTISLLLPPLLLLLSQIEGDHAMDAVFSSICCALDDACAKIGDPLEEFCASNPSDLECLVYDD